MHPILEQLANGLIEVDLEWRLRYANAAARRILDAEDALRLVEGRIGTVRPRDRALLHRLLDPAAPPELPGTASGARVDFVALQRVGGEAPYVLRRVAVRDGDAASRWLSVIDPVGSAVAQPTLLQQAFGLTAAEARLAVALAQGSTLQEVAQRQAIAVSTLRGYLESIFKKTSMRRQAELVRLVSAMVDVTFGSSGD